MQIRELGGKGARLWQGLLAPLLGLLSLVSWGTEFKEDDLRLLDVQFGQHTFDQGLDVYLRGSRFYVPLVDLVALLEIDVATDGRGAKGQLTGSGPRFLLQRQADGWLVEIDGERQRPAHGRIVVDNHLIYIDQGLAEDWFGLTLVLDAPNSRLHLKTAFTLPFEARLARKNRKVARQHYLEPVRQPTLDTAYAWFELPSADVRVSHITRNHLKEDVDTQRVTNYTLRTNGDLAGMSTESFLTGQRESGLSNVSLRMDRFDHQRSMGGPLGLSQISLGDLSHPGLPLAPGGYGRGVIIGNDTVGARSHQDVQNIEGDYFPGWEVELYLNGTLVDYQVIPEDGHYKFTDVVLFEGDNPFVLKFYGPNGRVDEKTQNLFVGADVQDTNRFRYTLSVSQPDKKLYRPDNDNFTAPEVEDVTQAVFTGKYTFGRALSLSAGVMQRQGEQQDETYYHAGIQTQWLGQRLSLDATNSNSEETDYIYSLSGHAFRMQYNLNITDYAEDSDTDNPLQSAYNLSLSRRFGGTSAVLRARRRVFDVGYNDEYRLGVSGKLAGMGWSNTLEYRASEDALGEGDFLEGSFFLSRSRAPLSLRMNVNYGVRPEPELNSVGASASYQLAPKTHLNVDVDHSLLTDATRYKLGMSWQLPYMRVTPSIIYGDDGLLQGYLEFSTSLGRRSGRLGDYYAMSSSPVSSFGSVKARLFEDRNMNGAYEVGEPLLSGGDIHALQAGRKAVSNSAGVAWLDNIKPWMPTDIRYVPNSVDEPFLTYSGDPFSVVARPGKATAVDLPFVRVGDVDGVVYRQSADRLIPARGVKVQISNEAGVVVDWQNTDSDGYYNFVGLRPSTYVLSVKGEALLNKSLSTVTINGDGNYVAGVELLLEEKNTQDELEQLFADTTMALREAPAPDREVAPRVSSAVAQEQWTVQVASYAKPAGAEHLLQRLRGMGYQAFAKRVSIASGVYTRVFVGPYAVKPPAAAVKREVDVKLGVDALLVRQAVGVGNRLALK